MRSPAVKMIITRMKRNGIICSIKKHWMLMVLGLCVAVVIYNMISNIPAFLSDGYARYKIQELELQNDLLLMQLGLSRDKIYTLMKNTSLEMMEEELACDIARSIPKCETIHIGIVCAGFKSSRTIVTLLKSILFYRKHPLHFHILVDDIAKKILGKLFETWDIPLVNITFYSAKEAISSVSWIPNNHYSGVYGLLKLTLPKILPTNVTKIIVLDTDLTFVANIAELWGLFTKFDEKQTIGLVENQSNWYLRKLRKNYNPWPAIGKGFNTGVILMHLKRLNKIDWANLWPSIAENILRFHTSTALADQDIFNTVIKQLPQLVFPISCQWNVQLSDNTLSNRCYENFNVKVIHWNSPRKHEVINKDVEYFRNIYYTFVEFNGYLLRTNLMECHARNAKISDEDILAQFQKSQHMKWRTHIFIREFQYETEHGGVDVTLVFHATINQLKNVEQMLKHWEGPVSIVFYTTDAEADFLSDYIEHSQFLRSRYNIGYHIIYKVMDKYPMNELRKIGIEYVKTKFVFLTDITYLPMLELYSNLKKLILERTDQIEKQVFIVPAFQFERYDSIFPRNKTEIVHEIETKNLMFVSDGEHVLMNQTKWHTATEPYKVQIFANSTIPTGLLVSSSIRKLELEFIQSWRALCMELKAQKYEFLALPSVFIIRRPSLG